MSSTDWATLKVVDLKAELQSRSLSIKGVKADLVRRLTEADAEAAAAAFFPDFFFAAMTDSGDLEVGSTDNYECAMQSLPAQKVTDKYLPFWCSMCF